MYITIAAEYFAKLLRTAQNQGLAYNDMLIWFKQLKQKRFVSYKDSKNF